MSIQIHRLYKTPTPEEITLMGKLIELDMERVLFMADIQAALEISEGNIERAVQILVETDLDLLQLLQEHSDVIWQRLIESGNEYALGDKIRHKNSLELLGYQIKNELEDETNDAQKEHGQN